MNIVYELTFFLALALLAIVVTVYVFSVTQIGRATELESKRQKDIISAQKEASEKQIENIQKQLDEAKKVGRLDDATLLEELDKGRREIQNYASEINRLKNRTALIKRFGATVWPGSAILATIVLAMIARGIESNHNIIALVLWIIGLVTLLIGIYRIFKTLGAIEEVTINAQEAIDKLPEAVKSALIAVEQQKKPMLTLVFRGSQPPIYVNSGQQINIDFALEMASGDVARNISVFFTAPPGFAFPSTPSAPAADDLPNYVSTCVKLIDLVTGLRNLFKLAIKAPATTGSYILVYQFVCEGFNSGRIPFPVEVK